LPHGKTLDDISPQLLEECCQLVKQNSIQGCKQNNVDIVYTKWSNLKKTADMVTGQIGFHEPKAVRKFKVEKKKSEILNRINKTKREEYPDLAAEREQYDKEMAKIKKQEVQVCAPSFHNDFFNDAMRPHGVVARSCAWKQNVCASVRSLGARCA
jgi:hypothetical protein